ncbi:MAG TPA: hypothetical protein VIO94_09235 [Phenylobacterium sp.]
MSDIALEAPPAPAPHTSPPHKALGRILAVVWMAIGLGVAVQLVVLVSKTGAGAPWPGLKWLPDLLNGVTWAVFVCAGVVLGTLASRARSAAMGLLGLISAPIGFSLAKGLQRGMQSMMEAPVDKITPALYGLAGVKAVEYACLGVVLGWLLSRPWAKPMHYALAGAVAGLTFGSVNVWILATVAKAKTPALVGGAVNEILFPIGCAMVIYLATTAARHVAAIAPHVTISDEPAADAGMPLA